VLAEPYAGDADDRTLDSLATEPERFALLTHVHASLFPRWCPASHGFEPVVPPPQPFTNELHLGTPIQGGLATACMLGSSRLALQILARHAAAGGRALFGPNHARPPRAAWLTQRYDINDGGELHWQYGGRSPLAWAASSGDARVVAALLDAEARDPKCDGGNRSGRAQCERSHRLTDALEAACDRGDVDIALVLLSRAAELGGVCLGDCSDYRRKCGGHKTPMCGNNHVERPTALDRACLRGDVAMVRLLYECAGITDEISKTLGRSPLAMACKGGGNPELVSQLATPDTWLSPYKENEHSHLWFQSYHRDPILKM
jgi:hypothetical protein